MRPLPPLTALRAFEAAARHGNFVKAAVELGVTAGAISQHIKGLEARLGLVLFRRLARGVRLTEAGRAYLPGIADGFDRLARATLQVHESGLAGRLTITVLPSFAAGWLVRRLPSFRTRHPDIDLVIRSERQTVDLHRDEADLAVRYGLGDFANLEATHLMREEIFPVCAPALLNADPPLRAPADLARHELLHDAGALGGRQRTFARDGVRRGDADLSAIGDLEPRDDDHARIFIEAFPASGRRARIGARRKAETQHGEHCCQ